MKTYEITRIDKYVVTVDAKSKKDALKKVNEEDYYMNNGAFMESVFDEETLEEV